MISQGSSRERSIFHAGAQKSNVDICVFSTHQSNRHPLLLCYSFEYDCINCIKGINNVFNKCCGCHKRGVTGEDQAVTTALPCEYF